MSIVVVVVVAMVYMDGNMESAAVGDLIDYFIIGMQRTAAVSTQQLRGDRLGKYYLHYLQQITATTIIIKDCLLYCCLL